MKLISQEGLKERGITLSKSQLNRMIKAGQFPKTVQMGFRKRAWLASEVDAWIEQRVAERDRSAA
jgi:prophage regulatory protein